MVQRGLINADICYPGDEIPNWFSYQTLGDSININLPHDWCNVNFLGFAPAIVLEWNNVNPLTAIQYEFNFKTINMESLEFKLLFRQDFDICSDHVVMLYGDRLCREIEQTVGPNWTSSFSEITEVSFHARIFHVLDLSEFPEDDKQFIKIKKCGFWCIYKEDAERLMDFEQPKVETQYK